ncbi:hypothetical protein ACSYAY_02665 [Leptospirillum ferriphilum]|jgi:hypothetical protein|uniref:PAS domain-containing protein n=2 Tax=Leptospirillum TaxID=179 RepID=A0A094WGZ5_9BACT|nr:hypothetical protein [Leptospirillum ferriphilum]EDZ39695.1 MAG: Protein of unknown function [Leptospirillum sp. Group II '5-way CG']KGA94927.1 hypothetical protein LptCag_2361 [Leptospirillum ferriphilum]
MGFFLFTRSLRDTTESKKILEMIISDNQTACFVVNEENQIVIFNDILSLFLGWSVNAVARKPLEDVLRHLMTQGQDVPVTLPSLDSVQTEFRVYKNFGKRGALLFRGYPLGGLPPPAGIYFLYRQEDPPTEKIVHQYLAPVIDKLYSRTRQHLAMLALDDYDLREIDRTSREILNTLGPMLQHVRVFLVNRVSMDDSSHFARILFDGPPESVQESLEGILYGDTIFFQRLFGNSGRPALVGHTELPWKYEFLFPFNWYHHVFGWMGIPVASLDIWRNPVRFSWQDALGELGQSMGLQRSRMGLLPQYRISPDGVLDGTSLGIALDSMIGRTPPRPFVLLLFRILDRSMRDEFVRLLGKAKRGTDFLGEHPEGLVAVFPDEDPTFRQSITDRYKKIFEKLIVSDFRFQCTISSYGFPAREWTSGEVLARLNEVKGADVRPAIEMATDDVVFDDWFKKFLLLKDFE